MVLIIERYYSIVARYCRLGLTHQAGSQLPFRARNGMCHGSRRAIKLRHPELGCHSAIYFQTMPVTLALSSLIILN
jgi:hypothetical protein